MPGQMTSGQGAPMAPPQSAVPRAPPAALTPHSVAGGHVMAPPPSAGPHIGMQASGTAGGGGQAHNNTQGYHDPNQTSYSGQGAWQQSKPDMPPPISPMAQTQARPGQTPSLGLGDHMSLAGMQAAAAQGTATGRDSVPWQGRPVSPEMLAKQQAYQQPASPPQGRPVSQQLRDQQNAYQQPTQPQAPTDPISLANQAAANAHQGTAPATGTGSSSQGLTAAPGSAPPSQGPATGTTSSAATPDYSQGGVDRNSYTSSDPYANLSKDKGETYIGGWGTNPATGKSISDDYNALARQTGLDSSALNQMMQNGWHFYANSDGSGGFMAVDGQGNRYDSKELAQNQSYLTDIQQNKDAASQRKTDDAASASDAAMQAAWQQANTAPEQLDQAKVNDLKSANTAQIARQQSLALRAAMEGGARAGVSPESTQGTAASIQTQGGIAGAQMNSQVQMQAELQNLQQRMQKRQDLINMRLQMASQIVGREAKQQAYQEAMAMQQQQYQDQRNLTEYQNQLANQITGKDVLGAVGGVVGTVGGAFAGAGAKKLFE